MDNILTWVKSNLILVGAGLVAVWFFFFKKRRRGGRRRRMSFRRRRYSY